MWHEEGAPMFPCAVLVVDIATNGTRAEVGPTSPMQATAG